MWLDGLDGPENQGSPSKFHRTANAIGRLSPAAALKDLTNLLPADTVRHTPAGLRFCLMAKHTLTSTGEADPE